MSVKGWEDSAILHHGSVLQFGCYTFTFSIVDHCKLPPETHDNGGDDENVTPTATTEDDGNEDEPQQELEVLEEEMEEAEEEAEEEEDKHSEAETEKDQEEPDFN